MIEVELGIVARYAVSLEMVTSERVFVRCERSEHSIVSTTGVIVCDNGKKYLFE